MILTYQYAVRLTLLAITLALRVSPSQAQDELWWDIKHNWDGVTPRWDYINTSPGYMGPNALPVPTIKNGTIPENAYLELGFDKHFGRGDNTENIYTELFFPLFTSRVGLNIEFVPIEHYKMDTVTRDLRKTLSQSGEGFANGDFYIGTYIQLIEKHPKLPDVLLTINLKTASGNGLSDARHTDAPGYFFDMSFGKKLTLSHSKGVSIKPHAMLGFYVWQLHGNGQFQNDALLYGLGADLGLPSLTISNSIGGYHGYLNNGDRPLVYRLILRSGFDTMFNYELTLQQGLQDYSYTTLRLTCQVNLLKVNDSLRKNIKTKK